MDEKDNKILKILKEDSSLTTRQIAKKTLIPITTVHKRIKKLTDKGIIKRFTIDIDNEKIGNKFLAYVTLNVDITKLRELNLHQKELVDKIKKMEEVESADIVVGRDDIVLKVRVKDVKEYDKFLFDKLHKIKGITSTNTLTVTYEG